MTRRIAALVTTLTLGATAAVAAPAAAGSRAPTAKAWANGVCSSVATWLAAVEDTISSLDSSDSLRRSIENAAAGIGDATQELVHDLDDLGLPPIQGAKPAKRALTELGDQLEQNLQEAEEVLADVGDGPLDLASTIADLGIILGRAVDHVSATADNLRQLDGNGKLRTALRKSSACASVQQLV